MTQNYLFILSFIFIKRCFSQQCVTKAFQKITHGKLNSTYFEPLLAFEENSYGKMWHICVLNCELDQRCIGFQLCKVTESLFYCKTCCRWKKIKGFTFIAQPGCKFVEKNIAFRDNLAYKRITVLSGTLDSNHSSSLAVDGVTLCPQNSNLVAVSSWSPVPWLMIELDSTYYIEKIVFYAGDGVYASQADDIEIAIDVYKYLCGGLYPGPTAGNDVILFMCPPGSRGSSVTIQKMASGYVYLGICEVEVYGF